MAKSNDVEPIKVATLVKIMPTKVWAEKGFDYIESFWTEKVPADVKAKMDIGFLEMVKASAADYDRIRAETSIAKDADLDDSVASLNSNIGRTPSPEDLEAIRQFELANGSD